MDADQGRAWITIKADSYECMLSVNKLRAFPNSHLANLADLELQRNHVNPSIRLDCEPEVAKELVAIVRHGSSYAAPSDNPRLCQALQHQSDFYLGIHVPGVHAANCLQEYLLMPTTPSPEDTEESQQLLMYNAGVRGWAAALQSNYCSRQLPHLEFYGTGTDMAFMIPDDPVLYVKAERQGALLNSDLTWGTFTAPHKHKWLAKSAMAAAQGKLYLL
eukprot:gene3166-3444_t